MKKVVLLLSLLCSTWAYSSEWSASEIRLVDYFGDYNADRSETKQVDLHHTSLAQLTEHVKLFKLTVGQVSPGALVIGYGNGVSIDSFIIRTTILDSDKTISQLMGELMPMEKTGSRWYFYFFQRPYDQYLYAKEKHHWASPFNWIINLGMKTKNVDTF